MRILNLLALLAVPAILTAPTGQAAQNKFPEKPIRLIVGSAAGSGPDIIGRMMAERLYETWKQRVVVDARPGAAGAISADLALGAAADGYTWMMLTRNCSSPPRCSPTSSSTLPATSSRCR